MSKWSDVAELLKQLITAKELIPVQSDLINLQQILFSLQSEQMKLLDENKSLKDKVQTLEELKKFDFAEGKTYLIDPEQPDRHLCPVHTREKGFAVPLVNDHCSLCKRVYD
jgi:hypothetical protein